MTPPNPTAPDADPIAVARAELARLKRSPVARLLGPPRLNEDWAEDLPAERDPGVTPEDDESPPDAGRSMSRSASLPIGSRGNAAGSLSLSG